MDRMDGCCGVERFQEDRRRDELRERGEDVIGDDKKGKTRDGRKRDRESSTSRLLL